MGFILGVGSNPTPQTRPMHSLPNTWAYTSFGTYVILPARLDDYTRFEDSLNSSLIFS